jgi:hypothetical protein
MHDFQVPAGKYYLADAGYPLCDKLLVPYRGVRYHLAEWSRADTRLLPVFFYESIADTLIDPKICTNFSTFDMHLLEMLLNVFLVF